DLTLLAADDRPADGRLVRELVLRWIGLGRADDVILERLLRVDVPQPDERSDGDDVGRNLPGLDHARVAEAILEQGDAVLEQRLVVLRVVVLGVLLNVAELARDADALRDLAPLDGAQILDLFLELLVALWRENDFLRHWVLNPL